MIGEVQKALTAYGKLDSTGKRLFRDELGLVRPQQARPRRKRAKQKGAETPTQPVRARRSRTATEAAAAEPSLVTGTQGAAVN